MKLTTLSVSAPGATMTHRIPDLVVIQGPNESGKSTMLQAVDALVLGSRSPTWSRYSDGPTELVGSWEDVGGVPGERAPWRVVRHVSGGKQPGVQVNGSLHGVKAADGMIDRVVGDACSFSVSAFLALNKREQLAMISGWMPPSVTWDRAFVHEEALKVAEINRPMLDVLAELEISPVFADDNIRAHVEQLIDLVRAVDLAANREVLRLDKVVEQDRSDMAASQVADLPAGTVALWRDRIAEIDVQLGELRTKLGIAQESERAIKAARARLNTRTTRLASVTADLEETASKIAQREQAIATLRKTLDADEARVAKSLLDVSDAARNRQAAEQVRVALQQQIDRASGLVSCADLIRPHVEWSLKLLRVDQTPIDAATRAFEHKCVTTRYDDVDTCRMWFIAGWDARGQAATSEAGAIEHQTALLALLDQAATDHNADSDVRRRLLDVQSDLDGLITIHAAKLRQHEAATTARGVSATALQREEAALAVFRSNHARMLAEQTSLNAQIAEAQAEVDEAGSGDTSAIEQAIEALKTDRATAQRNADRLSDHDGDQAARAKRVLDLGVARKRRTLARALEKGLVTVQARMVESVIHPLLRTASDITRAAYGYELELRSVDDSRNLAFMARRPGRTPIPIEHMSQSVRACIGIALRVAFMQLGMARSWKALLIDDFEHIDIGKRDLLIDAIVQTGVCDNIMIAAVSDGWVPDGRWPIITLGRTTAVGDECLIAK